jgi:hypothetical protein
MNWYNLVFYHVFIRYYKNGKYKNDIPWLTVSVLVGVCSYFYFLNAILLGYFFFISKTAPLLENFRTAIIGGCFVFVIINYFWFTYKKRYLKIYEEYKTSNNSNRVTEILSWIYIIVGFASVPIAALIIR